MKHIALLVAGFVCVSPVMAALHLELTQGVNAATPIAIVSFSNETNNVPGKTTMTTIISNDLNNSGEFRVLNPGVLSLQPTQLSQINESYWQKQGVNDIVIGQIQQIGSHRFQVSFQLVNLYAPAVANTSGATQGISSNAVLLSQTFTVYQPAMRQLSHHIADMIYQKITGVRGIFTTKIAYILKQSLNADRSRYQLIVADQDGFNPQVLLVSDEPMMSPTWTPNGRGLAYVSFEQHHAAIYLQNLATGGRQLLSRYPGVNNAPAFSPNARRLALVLSINGNLNIYVMNLATRQLTPITNDYAINTEPTWSSRGHSLYFTSDRSGGPQIYRYDFASKQISRITFDGNYNARACISPQGNTLVVMHRAGGEFSIAKQDLSSGRMTPLTGSGSDDSPSLAPNGKMVLYGTRFNGREVLGLVSMDGRIKLRLPSAEGDVQDPSWSPFLS